MVEDEGGEQKHKDKKCKVDTADETIVNSKVEETSLNWSQRFE